MCLTFILKQFEQNRVDGGREIMLEVQLAIDIETNFIYFEQQNDRKQKECEVRFGTNFMRFFERYIVGSDIECVRMKQLMEKFSEQEWDINLVVEDDSYRYGLCILKVPDNGQIYVPFLLKRFLAQLL